MGQDRMNEIYTWHKLREDKSQTTPKPKTYKSRYREVGLTTYPNSSPCCRSARQGVYRAYGNEKVQFQI